ncbi:MAG: hypothetical protein Terrestrivirus3_85 [Terrestrivirus sp.]|uniref:Uncharacterized protein n=1 Tax=Terrestrivirus sp. TaxID=2487775 RepID=A0A3G4ZLV1_9VIRU|nr:MAG: hypothetical protein Terrestrivirus3_85 [Terrestrivirus sp.]
MQNQICKGYFLKNKCTNNAREGFTTCESHKHQEDYTDEQLNNMKECSRCHKKFYGNNKRCNECGEATKKSNAIVAEKKGPKKMCKGILIKNERCKLYVRRGFNTCRQHKFQENYTDEQMNNLSDCSTCRRALVKKPGLCEECLDRGEKNREKAREEKNKLPDCFKCSEIAKNNNEDMIEEKQTRINKQINGTKYCGDHQIEIWINEVKANNKVPCTQYIRGCQTELEKDSEFVRCLQCRRKIDDILRDFKKGALKMGRQIELSDEEILKIRNKNCAYCNKKVVVDYEHGIDRIDNEKDYLKNNVNPCCAQCNIIKGQKKLEDFLNYCLNIFKNYPSKIFIATIEKKTYVDIKYKAKLRNINFELSKDEYENTIKYCCYYCKNTNNNKNALDRLDSNKSYNKDNVVSCCGVCNLMKNDYSLDDFISKIKSIVEYNKTNTINKKPLIKIDN